MSERGLNTPTKHLPTVLMSEIWAMIRRAASQLTLCRWHAQLTVTVQMMLAARGLPCVGSRDDLMSRLQEALQAEAVAWEWEVGDVGGPGSFHAGGQHQLNGP